jgi:hypothetical protein
MRGDVLKFKCGVPIGLWWWLDDFVLRNPARTQSGKTLWLSLNYDKTEKAENPLKSRQKFKSIIYEKVYF